MIPSRVGLMRRPAATHYRLDSQESDCTAPEVGMPLGWTPKKGRGRIRERTEGEVGLRCSSTMTSADPTGSSEQKWSVSCPILDWNNWAFIAPMNQSLDVDHIRTQCDLVGAAFCQWNNPWRRWQWRPSAEYISRTWANESFSTKDHWRDGRRDSAQ